MNVLALKLIARRREDLGRSLSLEQGKLIGSTVSAVRTIETLKASGLEDEAFGHWAGIQAKALNAEQELGLSSTFSKFFRPCSPGLTVAVILGIGGLRVIEGALTLGGLVAFQSLMASFSGPITALVNLVGSFQTIKGGLERLEDVYNYPLDTSEQKHLLHEARSDRSWSEKSSFTMYGSAIPFSSRLSSMRFPSPSSRARGSRWSAPQAAENRRSAG